MSQASGKSKRFAVVACSKHGVESDKWAGRMVRIAPPKNKADRREGGCPICAVGRNSATAQ